MAGWSTSFRTGLLICRKTIVLPFPAHRQNRTNPRKQQKTIRKTGLVFFTVLLGCPAVRLLCSLGYAYLGTVNQSIVTSAPQILSPVKETGRGMRRCKRLLQVILVCVKVCRSVRLRGGRSCADSARGTHPSGLPFSAAAGIGMAIIVAAPCPARQTDGGQGG